MAIEINNEEPQGEIFQEPDPVSENSEVYIIQEDTTKRGEFEKHYICSDGTYVVTTYAEAIHYKDDNDKWVDVDNRPMETIEGKYTTRNGDFGISVPSSAGEGHLMRMDKGEHSLSWTLSANKKAGTIKKDSNVSTMAQKPVQSQKMQVSTTKRPEIITSNVEQPHENHKVLRDEATFDLPNVSGKVRYNDLFGTDEGVSVVYTTYRNKIEEDIYIEKPTDITSFSMEVAAPELTARLNSDNSVDFLDNEGKVCYHVGIPYMMDADFVVLNDIVTTVTRLGDTWVITYTPDATWFTSDERVYPILLDPSITTNEYNANITDTYVQDGSTANHTSEQLLYLSYGGNDCKAIIRVNNLPTIDTSLPIIDAEFEFTALYCPFNGTTAMFQLDYSTLYKSRALSTYTYNMAAAASNSANLSYNTYLTYNTTVASFNLKNDILQILEGNGDFILGYDPDYSTVYCGPFCSSEYTTVSMRPVLSITYGYSLPEEMKNGGTYTFQNASSTHYITVPQFLAPIGTNIYQADPDSTGFVGFTEFQLIYNSETGGYKLHPTCYYTDSTVVLEVARDDESAETYNVCIGNGSDIENQEWLIVPAARGASYIDTFYIVLKSDMSLHLTAYGYGTGTSAGTESTSVGNIFVAPERCATSDYTSHDYFYLQRWNIYSGETQIEYDLPSPVSNGFYYIINHYTGRYLYKNSIMQSIRGTMDSIGENNVVFKITNLQNGYCTIQTNNGDYLYAYSEVEGSSVRIGAMDDSIPDKYQWKIVHRGGGETTIQSKTGEYYLSDNGAVDSGQPYMYLKIKGSNDSETYKRQTWRFIDTSQYDVPDSITLSPITVYIGDVATPLVTINPVGSYSVDADDFIYSFVTGGGTVRINQETGQMTGSVPGNAILSARHKTTGLLCYFNVSCKNYYESYLKYTYGFAPSEIELIVKLYRCIQASNPSKDNIELAWMYTRLLGGFQYTANDGIMTTAWNEIAGNIIPSDQTEEEYYVSLGFTEYEYTRLSEIINRQHSNAYEKGNGDFREAASSCGDRAENRDLQGDGRAF